MSLADDVAKNMMKKPKKAKPPKETDFLPTGSTILNLAFSGRVDGGYRKGLCYSFVGDSSSGKTVLALSAFAEATVSPHFRSNYFLQFADIEGGALMDMEMYFGKKAADGIQSWSADSLEDFYDKTDNLFRSNHPVILVLDSMDALWSEAQDEQVEKEANARKNGKQVSGSYGMDKPKVNSARLRVLANNVKKTNSIFIMISQTRKNIGWNSQFNPSTYSGGEAIKFYSSVQLWTSIRENLVHPKHGTQQGIVSQIKVTKNRICGWQGKIEVPILRGSGVDDIGGCVDFLVGCGHWKNAKKGEDKKGKRTVGAISAPELGEELPREQLIKYIEENDFEGELKNVVGDVWSKIESETIIERKRKYD